MSRPHVELEHGPGGTRVIIQDVRRRIWGPRAETYSPTLITAAAVAGIARRDRAEATTMQPDECTLPPLPALDDLGLSELEPTPCRLAPRPTRKLRRDWTGWLILILSVLCLALFGAGVALLILAMRSAP